LNAPVLAKTSYGGNASATFVPAKLNTTTAVGLVGSCAGATAASTGTGGALASLGL
jgi:hypothetical protein